MRFVPKPIQFLRVLIATIALGTVASRAHAAVTISSDQTSNMSCSGDVCAPTAPDAILNVTQLADMLASTNVEVTTTGSGVQAHDILIEAPLGWSSSSTLALTAANAIQIDQPVNVLGTAGLTISYGSKSRHKSMRGTQGDMETALSFGPAGAVTFTDLTASLAINGQNYTVLADLRSVAKAIARNPAGSYALANDYDASQDGNYHTSPIATEFTGNFEGLGHRIAALSIVCARSDCVPDYAQFALFRQVDGVVENLRLENLLIDVSGDAGVGISIGGLVSLLYYGTLRGDSVTGTIETNQRVVAGGLVEEITAGEVIHSQTNVAMTDYAGVAVTPAVFGGLAATCSGDGVDQASISRSFATGSIGVGERFAAGGLVGTLNNLCPITESFATGGVGGPDGNTLGGLLGSAVQAATVQDSYATGEVSGVTNNHLGGFIGDNYATLTSSYSTGQVVVKGAHTDPGRRTAPGKHCSESCSGGLAAVVFAGQFTSMYWDKDTSGQQQCAAAGDTSGCKGRTTAELTSKLPAGFSRKTWTRDPNGIVNSGFPYLINNPPPQ